MVIKFLIIYSLVIVAISRDYINVHYNYKASELILFDKYLHRIKQGFFLQLGGYNPVDISNTIKLSNWKGIIVEAAEQRATNIRDYEASGVTALNFALTNESGKIITFYQADDKGASSANKEALQGLKHKQLKVMTISLADLCHKYYKVKPTMMSLDLEGIGQSVLKSNDWTTDKCLPDIIHAEDFEPNIKAGQGNIQTYLKGHNYTFVQIQEEINKLFIHNNKLQFYLNESKINSKYLKSIRIFLSYTQLSQIIGKLLNKPFPHFYISSTHAAYVHIRQPSIINIVQINQYSNLISQVGPNRPLIIMEYDQQVSSIYLGTSNYTLEEVFVDNYLFKKITINLEEKQLFVYVFDNQKYAHLNLKILKAPTNDTVNALQLQSNSLVNSVTARTDQLKDSIQTNMNELQTMFFVEIILTIIITNIALFSIFLWIQKKSSEITGLPKQGQLKDGNSFRVIGS